MTALRRRSWSVSCAVLVGVAVLAAGSGCRGGDSPARQSPSGSPDAGPSQAPAARNAESTLPRVVVLGDSLAAGLGLLSEQAFPALLQRRLNSEGYDVEVVNAGISGDTTAGGLRRLDWALEGDVRVLILALGANDGLRGLPVEELKKNLAAIIDAAHERRIAVLLAGMEAPPNFGVDYAAQFRQVYRDLAVQYRLAFVPFLLEGVAGIPALNQADGIHPTAEGAQKVADHLWLTLKPMVDTALSGS